MLGPRTEIANRFKNFLRTYSDNNHYIFEERIRQMCESNKSSFEVEFQTLAKRVQILAYFLPEAPREMLEIFDEVARDLVLAKYPSYDRVTTEIHVRISELPLIEEIHVFRYKKLIIFVFVCECVCFYLEFELKLNFLAGNRI